MTRDMTLTQFHGALRRNGFKPAIIGPWFEDVTDAPGCKNISFGAVFCTKRNKIHRRSTIARLIRDRKAKVAKSHKRMTDHD